MKLVKEHIILEKFTEDSDPIADMNIGMIHQIKKWMKSKGYEYEDKDNALIKCAYYGKVEFVRYLIDAGANVHYRDDYALSVASNNGHIEVAKMLLDAGADVHAQEDEALRYASNNRHTDVVKLLLNAGANVHANDDEALRYASYNGNTEVVKLLKDHIAKEKKLKKRIKESLNEKFTDEDSDPIKDLVIGVRYQIEKWLEKYYITKYHINDDLTIDVNEQVNLCEKELEKLPDYIQFNIVYQHFDISRNKLISLKGCPYEIRESGMYYGNFWCFNNKLENLKYFPKVIYGNCSIENNLRKFSEQEVRRISNIGKDLEV